MINTSRVTLSIFESQAQPLVCAPDSEACRLKPLAPNRTHFYKRPLHRDQPKAYDSVSRLMTVDFVLTIISSVLVIPCDPIPLFLNP